MSGGLQHPALCQRSPAPQPLLFSFYKQLPNLTYSRADERKLFKILILAEASLGVDQSSALLALGLTLNDFLCSADDAELRTGHYKTRAFEDPGDTLLSLSGPKNNVLRLARSFRRMRSTWNLGVQSQICNEEQGHASGRTCPHSCPAEQSLRIGTPGGPTEEESKLL